MPERLSFDQIFVTNKCIEKMKGGIATRNYIFSVCEKSDINGSYTDWCHVDLEAIPVRFNVQKYGFFKKERVFEKRVFNICFSVVIIVTVDLIGP